MLRINPSPQGYTFNSNGEVTGLEATRRRLMFLISAEQSAQRIERGWGVLRLTAAE
jgi:hypothetical protein